MIYKILDYSAFSLKLTDWYKKFKRELPWRNTREPYKIWLAEIIMQQTRISQGLPYYEKFVDTFASVCELASAEEDKVLRLWQGLGYYSRAKNLHNCAKIVCQDYGGSFPSTYDELLQLPGIGPYTAAAIASMAFEQPRAVIDGNVQRVISRYLGIEENIAERSTQKKIEKYAANFLDQNNPGDYNHAIMDLGAIICAPAKPNCGECPVSDRCFAFEQNKQHQIPLIQRKIKRRPRYFYYWIVRHENRIILKKRDSQNIWRGLYEFYLVEHPKKILPLDATDKFIETLAGNEMVVKDIFEYEKHVLSHQDIYSFFIVLEINKKQYEKLKLNYSYQFYSLDEILQLPKPILIDKFLREKII